MAGTHAKTVVASVDIARSAHDVFGFLTDASRLPDWQPDVRQASLDEPANPGVGSVGREVRHVMGADRTIKWEVTTWEPDRRYGVRGLDGPVRAHVDVRLQPAMEGTHVDYGVEFEGHGVGKLIAVLARRGARKDAQANLDLLKQRLEAGA